MAKKHPSSKPVSAASSKKPPAQQVKVADDRPFLEKNWFWLASAVVFALVWITFGSALNHTFVSWDDHMYVTENPYILKPNGAAFKTLAHQIVALNYHPLTMWSIWANAAMSGAAAAKPFIATNIFIHALNAILVLYLVFLWTGKQHKVIAFLIALLFALHPLRVESVVWVSERKDVLYTFFFLIGAVLYWKYLDNDKKKLLWGAAFFMLLSCLSKAQAVVFPVVCLLMDYWKGREMSSRWITEKIPMFAMALLFGVMALDVQDSGNFHGLLTGNNPRTDALAESLSPIDNLRHAGYGYMMYVAKTFYPVNLCTYYPYPDKGDTAYQSLFWLGLVLMIGTFVLAALTAKRNRIFLFGIGFYFTTVALVLQIISVGIVIMADRYSYLPSVGLLFLIFFGIEKWLSDHRPQWQKIWWGINGVAVLALVFLTKTQVATWKDSESLWTNVTKYFPKSDVPREFLANWYGKQNRIDDAMRELDIAVRDGSNRPRIFNALANCYSIKADEAGKDTLKRNEMRKQALDLYSKAIEFDPGDSDNYYNRAISVLQYQPALAIEDVRKVAQMSPEKVLDMQLMEGQAWINMGKNAEAVAIYNKSIPLFEQKYLAAKTPEMTQKLGSAYLNRGIAKYNQGDKTGGKDDVQRALKISPQNPDAQRVWGQIKDL